MKTTNIPAEPFEQAKLDRLNELTQTLNAAELSEEEQQEYNHLYNEYLAHFSRNHKLYPFSKWILLVATVYIVVYIAHKPTDPFFLQMVSHFGLLFFLGVMGIGWYQIVATCRFINALVKKNGRARETAIYLFWSIGLYLIFWLLSPNSTTPLEVFNNAMSV